MAFHTSSGAIANGRGKRIASGLHEAQLDVRDGQIYLHVDGAVRRYFVAARLRRLARLVLGLGKRRRKRPRQATDPRTRYVDSSARFCPPDWSAAPEPVIPNDREEGGRS